MSYFIDYHLQPLVHKLPSFVKVTTHFLSKHLTIGNFLANSLIVTFDISLLYSTNSSHNEGINACELFLCTSSHNTIILLVLRLCDLIPMILTMSNFSLNFFSHPPLPKFFLLSPHPITLVMANPLFHFIFTICLCLIYAVN